jgi:hypothetical protein
VLVSTKIRGQKFQRLTRFFERAVVRASHIRPSKMPTASTASVAISWRTIHFIVAAGRQIGHPPNTALTCWMDHFPRRAARSPRCVDCRTRIRTPGGRVGARAAESQLQILLARRSGRSLEGTTFALRRLLRHDEQLRGRSSKAMCWPSQKSRFGTAVFECAAGARSFEVREVTLRLLELSSYNTRRSGLFGCSASAEAALAA